MKFVPTGYYLPGKVKLGGRGDSDRIKVTLAKVIG